MATSASKASSRRREMECAVCLNRLRQPKMLYCSHNFCQDCLEQLVRDQKIACPTCKEETPLRPGGVKDLPKNTTLINIMATLCEGCYGKDREVCCQCGLFYCKDCHDDCKLKHKLTDKGNDFLTELEKQEKEIEYKKTSLVENVQIVRSRIEKHKKQMIHTIELSAQRLNDELDQEEIRQSDALGKFSATIGDLKKIITRKIDENSLRDEDISEANVKQFTSEWDVTLSKCTSDIFHANKMINFASGEISFSFGELSIKSTYEIAQIEYNTFGSKGSAPGQFDRPKRIAFSPVTKNMIVLDGGNNRVQVFNERHNFLLEFGSKGDGEGQFNIDDSRSGLAVTEDGLIVVADTKNHRLQVFTERGKYVRSIGSEGSGPGQLYLCDGLDFHDGLIYVCDQVNNRVKVFEVSGKFVRQFGSRKVFSPVVPLDVTVCPNKDVVVAASHSKHPDDGKLVVFTADGKNKETINNFTNDSNSVKVHRPIGVTTNNSGHIIVSDYHTHNIHIIMDGGRLLRTVGSSGQGQGPGKLYSPIGLVCSEDGDIAVADCGNHHVQVFSFK